MNKQLLSGVALASPSRAHRCAGQYRNNDAMPPKRQQPALRLFARSHATSATPESAAVELAHTAAARATTALATPVIGGRSC